ncbi:MAG: 5'-deoxynucleotidase [Clostridiaceae bacterium]|jgi:5'-deoxynucleotidase|nr:5'-deoxynucleotidase [Clostridiaceae bacterium]
MPNMKNKRSYNFYALLSRMRYIERWPLMRNTQKENILEHSADVAIFAQALAIIDNEIFGGDADVNLAGSLALYHDVSEVITGDLATPVKYFNTEIKKAYKDLERVAEDKLMSMLPLALAKRYEKLMRPDVGIYEYKLVKAADKISAYLKCVDELSAGNNEFSLAADKLRSQIAELKCREADYFLENFTDGYGKPLDTL